MNNDNEKQNPYEGAGDGMVVYCNTAQVSSSHYDFRLRFGLIQDSGTPKVLTTVYMAPGHAKAFLKALRNQVERFEAKMGEIPINLKEALTTHEDKADAKDETD